MLRLKSVYCLLDVQQMYRMGEAGRVSVTAVMDLLLLSYFETASVWYHAVQSTSGVCIRNAAISLLENIFQSLYFFVIMRRLNSYLVSSVLCWWQLWSHLILPTTLCYNLVLMTSTTKFAYSLAIFVKVSHGGELGVFISVHLPKRWLWWWC